jgi:hypothetical protein
MRTVTALTLALLTIAASATAGAQPRPTAAKVPRIVIHPRNWTVEPGPNAKRYCTSRLVQQDRPSGAVIVPVMTCWWQ